MHPLIFRRQFVLSNKELDIPTNWLKTILETARQKFWLNVHPDLAIEQIKQDDRQVIVLGYVLDPFHPEKSSLDITREMASKASFDDVIAMTHTFSGRFLVIFSDQQGIRLVNDAEAFREIYYYNNSGTIACGSTSRILAHYLNIPMDTAKEVSDYFQLINGSTESKWVGDESPYAGIKHLLANHYLNLIESKTYRFWPVEEKQEIKLKDAAELMAEILKGTYKAAINRFTLHQGLTGGWDTRVLLASSKEFKDSIHYYFIRGFKSDIKLGNSLDYTISSEIAQTFHIPFDVFYIDRDIHDQEFKDIYFGNNVLARTKLLSVYHHAYQNKLDNTVTVAGTSANEILRLMSTVNRNTVDPRVIAMMFGYPKNPYVIDMVYKWLSDALTVKKTGYKIIDLFFWENLIGNWGNLSGSEQDIVREEMRPFNNRLFLSTYISLKDKYRYKDYPMGHVEIIKHLWPELMRFDIDTARPTLKKVLRTMGIEQLSDKILQQSRNLNF
jgi:hypothetical protein